MSDYRMVRMASTRATLCGMLTTPARTRATSVSSLVMSAGRSVMWDYKTATMGYKMAMLASMMVKSDYRTEM